MAEIDIHHLAGGEITDDSDRYLYVPSLTEDARISVFNHHESIFSAINDANILIGSANTNIALLQQLTAKTVDSNKSTSYTFNLAYNALLEYLIPVWKSGASVTVRIGTTAGGAELSGDTIELNGTTRLRNIIDCAHNPTTLASGNQVIYVTINGGIIDLVRLYKTNILTT